MDKDKFFIPIKTYFLIICILCLHYLWPVTSLCIKYSITSFAFDFCRFSASEALKHPWITGEGHFDVHKRHMPDVSKTFRDTFGKKVLPDRPGHLGPTGMILI